MFCPYPTSLSALQAQCVVLLAHHLSEIFQAIAEICDIFNEPLTASPEATVPTSLLTAGNATAVSIAIPTSISSEPVGTVVTTSRNATMAKTSPAVATALSTPTPTSSAGSVAGSSGSKSASATAAQSTGRAAAAVSYGAGLYVAGTFFGLLAGFVF